MIEISDGAAAVLAGDVSLRFVRLESWLDGELLADDIPGVAAVEEQDGSLRVPERLTFTVPATEDGVTSWVPAHYEHPLGAYGQRVRVSLGVASPGGEVEWINRGWFLINTSEPDGDAVNVECLGLLALVDEAVLINEYQPTTGALLTEVCRDLIEPGITINDDNAPADRAVPGSITMSDNRLDNFLSILDAWPAEARMSEDGFLVIAGPALDPDVNDVDLVLTDGQGGTLISAGAQVTREGAFNMVVAKGQWPDTALGGLAGQEIFATAIDVSPLSPYRQSGPFSPYLVPYGYASPLLTTPLQARAAADKILRRLRRNASRTVNVSCVPHPAIQLGDVVQLTSSRLGLDAVLGVVDRFTLPYHPDGGSMALTVRMGDPTAAEVKAGPMSRGYWWIHVAKSFQPPRRP